ncbi:MAG: hypothetical protein L3J01_01745 [Thiomicrorhabdus sp.]|nr:hypothetical protein [Thiomicrorhabdus sp.]
MFNLFRHYRIEAKLNRYAVLFSLSVVLAWLYFSFIEKSFVGKIMSGEALLVDFVLGLPLIFMFTVIIYACAYWLCKWLVIFFLPHAMIPYSLKDQMSDDETKHQEEAHGENYWQDNDKSVDHPTETDATQHKESQPRSQKKHDAAD